MKDSMRPRQQSQTGAIAVAVLRCALLNRSARRNIRMNHVTTRPAVLSDLPRLADIYNHYILNTPITFNTQPFSLEGFAGWFKDHSDVKRHRLVIAVTTGNVGRVTG